MRITLKKLINSKRLSSPHSTRTKSASDRAREAQHVDSSLSYIRSTRCLSTYSLFSLYQLAKMLLAKVLGALAFAAQVSASPIHSIRDTAPFYDPDVNDALKIVSYQGTQSSNHGTPGSTSISFIVKDISTDPYQYATCSASWQNGQPYPRDAVCTIRFKSFSCSYPISKSNELHPQDCIEVITQANLHRSHVATHG